MDHSDRVIRRFRRYLATLLILKYALPLATAWVFAWGVAVLALRAAVGVGRLPLLWGSVGLAACVVVGLLRARRRWPSSLAVRALLDEQSGCGGLLMAGAEQQLGAWRGKIPTLTPPRVRWDGRRPVTLLLFAAGFVLLSFLAPQGLADLSSAPPLEVDREVARLLEQIALLKDEGDLGEERADTLQEKLAGLLDNSSGKDPSRTLEALDHVRGLAGQVAREGAEKRARRGEDLAEAEALAAMMQKAADLIGPELKKEALAELAGLLQKNGPNLRDLARQIDPRLLHSMGDRLLDPRQMSKLTEMLRESKTELLHQAEKMHRAGLIDAELLARCQQASQFDAEGLRAFLKDTKGKTSLAELKNRLKGGGEGGVNPGPGQAPLMWNKPGAGKDASFKEEVLPPGALASLRSRPIRRPGDGRREVSVREKPSGPASSGALRAAAGGEGSANATVILPRHRAAVERYFDRPSSAEK
jgi:hypothetical protein